MDTRGRTGELIKTVTVSSNDPRQPRFSLTVKGKVEALVAFEPEFLDFGRVGKGVTLSQRVKLKAKEPDKLKIEEVSSGRPEMVTVEKVDTPEGLALQITLKVPDAQGPISANLTVRTNLDAAKMVSFLVSARVSPDVVADPEYLFVPPGAQGQYPPASLRLFSLSGRPFMVKKLVDDRKNLVAKLQKTSPSEWKVELQFGADHPEKRGKVTFQLDSAEQPQLEVTYSLQAPPPPPSRLVIDSVQKNPPATQPPKGDFVLSPSYKDALKAIQVRPDQNVILAPKAAAPSKTVPVENKPK